MMIDTNIVIDIREEDPRWFGWSSVALAKSDTAITASAIVAAELAIRESDDAEIKAMLRRFGIVVRSFDVAAGYRAGAAYRAYRADGGGRDQLLADFLIGAHAVSAGETLLTRDPRHYRRYFPDLPLITPETDT